MELHSLRRQKTIKLAFWIDGLGRWDARSEFSDAGVSTSYLGYQDSKRTGLVKWAHHGAWPRTRISLEVHGEDLGIHKLSVFQTILVDLILFISEVTTHLKSFKNCMETLTDSSWAWGGHWLTPLGNTWHWAKLRFTAHGTSETCKNRESLSKAGSLNRAFF